jgi:hypothetical protein
MIIPQVADSRLIPSASHLLHPHPKGMLISVTLPDKDD